MILESLFVDDEPELEALNSTRSFRDSVTRCCHGTGNSEGKDNVSVGIPQYISIRSLPSNMILNSYKVHTCDHVKSACVHFKLFLKQKQL